ncbi:hypothetical protein [Lacrimispora sp. JR3]|uniref:hypothetical protein n=1 Tax=Lacrimispora sinapis TaxID=3111456 RepID=UPI00374A8A0B
MKKTDGIVELKEWQKLGTAAYVHQYPDSTKEDSYFYQDGMFLKNSRAYDLTRYPFFDFKLQCEEKNTYQVTVDIALFRDGKPEEFETYTARAGVSKTGTYDLELPAKAFDNCSSSSNYLTFVRRVAVKGEKPFTLLTARLKEGKAITLSPDRYGKAGDKGSTAVYRMTLKNCTDAPQSVNLSWKKYGNEATEQVHMPEEIELEGLEEKTFSIEVPVSERIVEGGYEKQLIQAIPDGDAGSAVELTLYTSARLAHPFVLLTETELAAVKEKIKNYEWARKNYEGCVKEEAAWEAPRITGETDYLFWTDDGHHARKCAILYRLGAGEAFKQKALLFLKELSDPKRGYLVNPRACNQELVHEGEFFKSVAFAYDLLYDCEELTKEDHSNMEAVLKKFMGYIDQVAREGNVSNWALAEIEGALYGACVLQDMAMIQRFLYGTGGMTDILSRGVMSDGWWYEASIGYNLLAAGIFSEIAHVMLHFGMDLRFLTVPASYSKRVDSVKLLKDGLIAESWGGNDKTYRNISMLWDSLVNFYDYRGVIFGLNDSSEMHVQGTSRQLMDSRYDLAYALYGKKEYAALLRLSKEEDRDLLFGVGELPKEERKPPVSDFADSSGACVLRSRKEGVPDREQLQVVLKYGSHGGAHGHYDRVSMTGLSRFGRSLTGPENIWYSYHTMMYKFYTQTSLNHNMVVVDYKMQEAVPPKRLLFYSGTMMQAAAVQSKGPWSHPPYGGWQVNGDRTLKERSWNEGRYLPTPEPEPEYSVRSGFTEPVLTRRLTVVTDEFVVNFDYAKGEAEHDFACLYHLQGLRKVMDLKERPMVVQRWAEQLDTDMLGSAQFITDCQWYEMEQGAVLDFTVEYTETENNGNKWLCRNRTGYNEPGIMHTRLYGAYPAKGVLAIGCDPEYQGVNKQLFYSVEADGKELANGRFGAWILGRETVDADISGKGKLVLTTRVNQVEFEEHHFADMEKSIFWGDPAILTEDGTWIYLSELPYETENIDPGNGIGIDYGGGPVKIQAKEQKQAVPAEPVDLKKEGRITVDLEGLHAVRFRSEIGGDYPVGDESGRRRTAAFSQKGIEAAWITVLETTEREYVIKKVTAEDEKTVAVDLADGRRILIRTEGMDSGDGEIRVWIEEWKDGCFLRGEHN